MLMFLHLARCFLLLNVLPIRGNMLVDKIVTTDLFLVTRFPIKNSGRSINRQFQHWLKIFRISSMLPYKEYLAELPWPKFSAILGWGERLWQNNNSKLIANNILTELKLLKLISKSKRATTTSFQQLTRGQKEPAEKLTSTTIGTIITHSKNFQRHKISL